MISGMWNLPSNTGSTDWISQCKDEYRISACGKVNKPRGGGRGECEEKEEITSLSWLTQGSRLLENKTERE